MRKLTTVLFLVISLNAFSQKKASNVGISEDVRQWVETYFSNKKYFHHLSDTSVGLSTPSEIKNLYHVFFVEKQKFDSVNVVIYRIGTNYSVQNDMLLIYKTYPRTKHTEYVVIGETPRLENVKSAFHFFTIYNKFSNKCRTSCYELLIGESVDLEYYPK